MIYDTQQLEFAARALTEPGAYAREERLEFATIVRAFREVLDEPQLTKEDVKKIVGQALMDLVGAVRHVEFEYASGSQPLLAGTGEHGTLPERVPDLPFNRFNRIIELFTKRYDL